MSRAGTTQDTGGRRSTETAPERSVRKDGRSRRPELHNRANFGRNPALI